MSDIFHFSSVLFAVSDAVLVQLGTALIAMVGSSFSVVMVYFVRKLDQNQELRSKEASAKVEEVKSALLDSVKVGADKLDDLAKSAAIKVAEVKKTLESSTLTGNRKLDQVAYALEESTANGNQKLDSLASVAKATHTLVNSNMGVQLQLNAKVTRRLADMTKDQDDFDAANLAERLYREHQGKQLLVDEQPGTHEEKSGN